MKPCIRPDKKPHEYTWAIAQGNACSTRCYNSLAYINLQWRTLGCTSTYCLVEWELGNIFLVLASQANNSRIGFSGPVSSISGECKLEDVQVVAMLVRRCVAGDAAAWEEIVRT